jgi:hypothetical protein
MPRRQIRRALEGDRFRWDPPGGDLIGYVYGAWRLEEALEKGESFAAEGASDCWCAWAHNVPCFGIPGADHVRQALTPEILAVLECLERLYIVREPGPGGTNFVRGFLDVLPAHLAGRAWVVQLPAKDLRALHLATGEGFADALVQAKAAAIPLAEALPTAESGTATREFGTWLKDLLAEPEETTRWLVDNRIPTGSFSLVGGKPKVGKTTFLLGFGFTVSLGEPWLGWATTQGTVLYFALEDKRGEVARRFRLMGATGAEPIVVFTEVPAFRDPKDAVAYLRRLIDRYQPVLVILDPVFRLVQVMDSNDYMQVMRALEPLQTLARTTGVAIVGSHHLKKGETSGAEGLLGSQQIRGIVDTSLFLERDEHYRMVWSEQRYGTDLEEKDKIVLDMDPVTGVVTAGPSRETVLDRDILEQLPVTGNGKGMSEADLLEAIGGNRVAAERALRKLFKGHLVDRTKNGRGFLYTRGQC